MPYKYFEEEYTADIGFQAWGATPEKMFAAAADATMNVMVEDLEKIEKQITRHLDLKAESMEMLLFDFLQELIFFKDARQLLLRISQASISVENDLFQLSAEAFGETLNPEKHELSVDVKAVTMHHFSVEKRKNQWRATVVLDV